jgi:hypothetical protein
VAFADEFQYGQLVRVFLLGQLAASRMDLFRAQLQFVDAGGLIVAYGREWLFMGCRLCVFQFCALVEMFGELYFVFLL